MCVKTDRQRERQTKRETDKERDKEREKQREKRKRKRKRLINQPSRARSWKTGQSSELQLSEPTAQPEPALPTTAG